MKKTVLSLLICFALYNQVAGQTVLTLIPDAITGKDAIIDSRQPATNFDYVPDFFAAAWTNGGDSTTVRSLVEFDLSSIPQTAIINSAYLSLYSYNSPGNGSHSSMSGPNDCIIQKITSDWDKSTVTWDNQPSVTNLNLVALDGSISSIQDYLNIDVTAMVQDMTTNPLSAHGFRMKLITEVQFRRMLFGSSNNSNANLRPKLVVTYSTGVGIMEQTTDDNPLETFPNPANDKITVALNNYNDAVFTLELMNYLGEIVYQSPEENTMTSGINKSIDLAELDLSNGIYIVRVKTATHHYSKKIIIHN